MDVSVFTTIVLDGVGIGEQPDSVDFGDAGSDTLGHVCAHRVVRLPNLARLGLGRIRPLAGVDAVDAPIASYGKLTEVSPGKDSTTGHWELAGLVLDQAFPLYPDGFPEDVVEAFLAATGCPGLLGNRPASGTEIIAALGAKHLETGAPIVYTSADSVFQVAAHVGVVPLERQYEICRLTREAVCVGRHAVGRVIARPFDGEPGSFARISPARKDFSMRPPRPTLIDALQRQGVATVSIGKVHDLFGGTGFSETYKTRSNEHGIRTLVARMREAAHDGRPTFVWINLIDFDQEFGHRNDTEGFAKALEAFDRWIPSILALLPEDGRLAISADHGNDPTTPGSDHSREYVPLLYYGAPETRDLGTRRSFCDHAATVAAFFGFELETQATSFEQFVPADARSETVSPAPR